MKEEAEGAELCRELLVEQGKSEVWRTVAESLNTTQPDQASQARDQFCQLANSQTEGFRTFYINQVVLQQ